MRLSARSLVPSGIMQKFARPQSLLKIGAASASGTSSGSNSNLLLLALYFAAWYALNVGYNITNKQVLNVFPLYATTAVIQLLVAWVWLIPQWIAGIRPVPKPSEANLKALQKVSLLHGFGHLVTVLSMGLGAVSFVHVVKAMEPVFAAALSAVFAGTVMAAPVYASLLPVCAGVAIASAGELSFSWGCFGAAMMSNLLFASRAVFSKMAMSGKDQGENMDAANTFAVVTMLATVACLPVALILEGPKIQAPRPAPPAAAPAPAPHLPRASLPLTPAVPAAGAQPPLRPASPLPHLLISLSPPPARPSPPLPEWAAAAGAGRVGVATGVRPAPG